MVLLDVNHPGTEGWPSQLKQLCFKGGAEAMDGAVVRQAWETASTPEEQMAALARWGLADIARRDVIASRDSNNPGTKCGSMMWRATCVCP